MAKATSAKVTKLINNDSKYDRTEYAVEHVNTDGADISGAELLRLGIKAIAEATGQSKAASASVLPSVIAGSKDAAQPKISFKYNLEACPIENRVKATTLLEEAKASWNEADDLWYSPVVLQALKRYLVA